MRSLQKPSGGSSWQNMGDWRLVLPPSRPGKAQQSYVQSAIMRVCRDSNVAILGSTVEYRELLDRMGFQNVFVLEKNKDFYDWLNATFRPRGKHSLILGDWLETLPVCPGKFTVILSHLTSGNVPYQLRRMFYSAIATALTEGGVFVDFILRNDRLPITRTQIEQKFRNAELNIATANRFSCSAIFCSDYVMKHGVLDTDEIYRCLYNDLDVSLHPLVDLAQLITPLGGKWFYGKDWSEVDKYAQGLLDEIDVKGDYLSSPYHNRAYNVTMRRAVIKS